MHNRNGFCDLCGKPLIGQDLENARNQELYHGFGYMHQWCFDLRHPVFITREEAEIKWADKIRENPELLNLY